MAERLNISPSYLNLMEHNQRALTRPLIARLSEEFGVDVHVFSGSQEARLLADLTEILGDPLFGGQQPRPEDLNDVVGASPALCRAFLNLYRAYRSAREEMLGLSERLAEDPFLTAASHQLLTLLTSVRSFAEILQDNVELAEFKRQEFAGILVQESEKLTDLVNRVFDFIGGDAVNALKAAELPADEVSDAIQAQNNHFPELESAAESLRRDLSSGDGGTVAVQEAAAIERYLKRVFGLSCKKVSGLLPMSDGGPDGLVALEESKGQILYSDLLPSDEKRMRLLTLVAQQGHGTLLGTLTESADLTSAEAQVMYRQRLARYLATAAVLPYEDFLNEAKQQRHDLDGLARSYNVPVEAVCERLTTLQRPGQEGVPFHMVQADIAGNVLRRFSASGLSLPRFGGICPRWNLHEVFWRQGAADIQLAQLPDGATYIFLARTVATPPEAPGRPASRQSIALGCDASFAAKIVYADVLNLDSVGAVTPVGVNCRLCSRLDCAQRAYPSLLAEGTKREESGIGTEKRRRVPRRSRTGGHVA